MLVRLNETYISTPTLLTRFTGDVHARNVRAVAALWPRMRKCHFGCAIRRGATAR